MTFGIFRPSILLGLALASFTGVQNARASYYNFQCPNQTEVEFYNQFDNTWADGLRFNPTGPTVIRIQSPGGPVDMEETILTQLDILAGSVTLNTGGKLRVIVTGSCASACTIFTSALNQRAGLGQIVLQIDQTAQFGFHAASDQITGAVLPASLVDTYYEKYGISSQWLDANQAVFSTTNLKWVAPNDPWLSGSQFLSHATLVSADASEFPIPSSASCTAGPNEY